MKNKNQTESLKFRKEDGEPSNPNNNVLTSEQHRIWKRRNKVKVTLVAVAAVIGIGSGLGAGYAIGHSQNNHPTPVLSLSANISNNNLQLGTLGTATLSVTEINATEWTNPTVDFGDASGSFDITTFESDTGLTRTATISLSENTSIVAGSYTITISANNASIDQNISVAPETPTPALSASISNNNLKIGTPGTATLSVTEINADGWTDPTLTVPTGLIDSGSWTISGLTGTTTISLSSDSSLAAGSYTITISANNASIDQNVSVAPAIPTPTLSAAISVNTLQLGTLGTATLSVTEINTTSWTDPTLAFDSGSSSFTYDSWSKTANPLTKTTAISLSPGSSPTPGPHTITISLDGYESITQTFTVLPEEITLVISPATLRDNTALAEACNLSIDSSGVLNKKYTWNSSTNTAFTTYLNNPHITTIRFEGISSIADSAFYNCSALAASISLPSSLTSIGSSTFQNCTNLRRVEFDTSSADATVSILYGAFSGCTNLTGLWKTSPNHHLYLGSIGYWAFENCVSLSIDGIDGIEVSQDNQKLKKVKNENGEGATIGIGIVNRSWDQANCMIVGDMGSELNSYFTGDSIGQDAFYGCASLTSLDLSGLVSSLTSINSYAFKGCSKLTTIGLSKLTKLTYIFPYAFHGCAALTTVDLSNTKVSSIAQSAFNGCTNLTTLKLPPTMFTTSNTASIEQYVFSDCTSLNAIYIPADAIALPNNCSSDAFYNCPETGTIYYSGSDSTLANAFKARFNGLNKTGWSVSPTS